MITWLSEKGASTAIRNSFGRTALDVAAEIGFADYLNSSDALEVESVSQALRALGYTTNSRFLHRKHPMDIAVVHGNWIVAKALSTLNTSSSILSTDEMEDIVSLIDERGVTKSSSQRNTPIFPRLKANFEPQTKLDVSRTSLILRFCLKRASSPSLYEGIDSRRIIRAILDYAKYWVRTTDAVWSGSNSRLGFANKLKQQLSAQATLSEGQLRKIELYVTRPESLGLAYHHYGSMNVYSQEATFGEEVFEYAHSPYQTFDRQTPYVRPPLLEISRRSKAPLSSPASRWLKDAVAKDPKVLVPSEDNQWTRRTFDNDDSVSSKDYVWVQTWDLPFGRKNSANVQNLRQQAEIRDWLKSISEGDEIILQPTEQFFAQDIARFSELGLAVYTAWV